MSISSSDRLRLPDEKLWDRWTRWARERTDSEAILHWVTGMPPHRWTWGALVESAREFAIRLRGAGVRSGEACALIVRHHQEFYPLYMAVSAIGAIPSVLAYPNARIHPDKFVEGLTGMARRSGLDWILTERELTPVVSRLVTGASTSVRGILHPLEEPASERLADTVIPPTLEGVDAPCLLQHSSGTTGLQKAVVLSHRAVLRHVEAYGHAIGLRADDRSASWLPLYHDMGMIAAFHLPLALGIPVIQLDPFEWVSAPVILLEAMSQEQATMAWLPNFAYNLLADRVRDDDLEGIRLDSVRLLVNCSEPVRADSHRKFAKRFERFGLRPSSLGASYAMAETTFAATQTAPGREARCLEVDRDSLSAGVVAAPVQGRPSRTCVSSGAPISHCELRIVGEAGADLPAGHVGEIAIRSDTMFDGYRNAPEETARVLEGGWYFSGDLGFLDDGECFVIGRKKDLIIVAGKNLYPEDVEDVVGKVPGVIPGRVVAFGVEDASSGTERIAVVAETSVEGESGREALILEIRRAGMAIDVTISEVHLAPPRWLIKSSSGKPSRRANRERIIDGHLDTGRSDK